MHITDKDKKAIEEVGDRMKLVIDGCKYGVVALIFPYGDLSATHPIMHVTNIPDDQILGLLTIATFQQNEIADALRRVPPAVDTTQ